MEIIRISVAVVIAIIVTDALKEIKERYDLRKYIESVTRNEKGGYKK